MPDDTIEKLKSQKEVATVIKARDEFRDDLNIVLPLPQVSSMRRQQAAHVRRFNIEYEGEQIQTLI